MDIQEERDVKRKRVIHYLDLHQLDGVLLSRRCNFSWYTCGAHNYVNHACDAGNSWLLVDRRGSRLLTSNIEATRMRQEEFPRGEVEVIEFPYFDPPQRGKIFKDTIGSMKIAADAPVPWCPLPALDSDFDQLRWTLTESEIVRYGDLCDDTLSAVEYVARDAQRGVSENELAGMVSGALRCAGCQPWVILTAADERIEKFRHPLPTSKQARRVFMIVVTAERHGLIAACSRLVSFGPVGDMLSRKHQAVMTVDTAMIGATRPGKTLGEIFAAGQVAYAEMGFPNEWRLHHQGGSCGYLSREVVATPSEQTKAQDNQAFAWNPSIAGTKSEDTIICLQHETRLLARPTDWPMVEVTWKGTTISRPAILIR